MSLVQVNLAQLVIGQKGRITGLEILGPRKRGKLLGFGG